MTAVRTHELLLSTLTPTMMAGVVAAIAPGVARAQEARGLLALPPVSVSVEVGAAPGVVRPGLDDAGPLGVAGVELRFAPIAELAIHAAVELTSRHQACSAFRSARRSASAAGCDRCGSRRRPR